MIKVKAKKIIIFILAILVIGSFIYGFLYLYQNFSNLNNIYLELKSSITELENNKTTYYSNIEIDSYKQTIENLRYYNDKILNTIYWAIGSLAIAMFAIVGANIFFNFSISRKEIENIKKSFGLEIETVKNEYDKLIQSEVSNFIKESNKKIKEDFKSLSDNLQNQIKIMSDNFGYQISTNKDKLEYENEKLLDKLSQIEEKFKNEVKDISDSIIDIKGNIQIELFDIIARIWLLDGVEINALNIFVDKALLEIELNQSLGHTLGQIIDILGKIKEIDAYYITKINKLINKIPDENKLLKEKIESIIKNY